MGLEKELRQALTAYAEAEKEYARAVIERLRADRDYELSFTDSYLGFRQEKNTEKEAERKAKLANEELLKRTYAARIAERKAEAIRDVAKERVRALRALLSGGANAK